MKVKRVINYLIVLLISILSFKGIVNAAEGKEITLNFGQSVTLLTEDQDHQHLTCQVTNGNISESPFELIKKQPDPSTTFGVQFLIAYNRVSTTTGTITVDCEYYNNSISNLEPQHKTYLFSYGITSEQIGYMTYSLNYGTRESIDLYASLDMTKFISIDLNDSDGILLTDCSSNKCVVSLNKGYGEITNTDILGTVKYKTRSNGQEIESTTSIVFKISGMKIQLITSGAGTCNALGSDWTKIRDNLYESSKLGEISVPDCNPDTSSYPLLKFEGWVGIAGSEVDSYQSGQTINTCKLRNPVKGHINAQNGGVTYFPCYANANGIVINGNGNTVEANPSDGWVAFGISGSYYKRTNSNIVLPRVEITGPNSENKEPLGWYNQDSGIYYQSGETVPADGSTYIFQVKTITFHRNYYKAIYVNEPYLLKPSEADVTECRSARTDIIRTSGSGECILYGLKQTDDYIDVTVYGKNGYQKVFYVTVVSRNNLSESGDNPFIINIDPNVISSLSDSGTLNSYIVDSCSDFSLNSTIETGEVDGGGANILGYKFNKRNCNSNIRYNSYCIDSGRLGPTSSGMSYIKSETIGMNSDFGKLITYMGRQGLYDDNPQHVADVTNCIRIVGIQDNISVASEYNIKDKNHADSYEYYAKIAEEIYDSSGKIIASKVNETDLNSTVKNVLINYQSVEDTKAAGFEREIEDIKYSEIDSSGNYTVTFKGKMYIPGKIYSVANPTTNELEVVERLIEEAEDSSDPTRTVYNFNITLKANIYNLHLPYTVNKNGNVTSTPSVLELTKAYCFKVAIRDSAGMDAFMMEPEGAYAADGYQRMVTVNSSDLSIYVYFPPSPSINACGSVDALDWRNSNFNDNLFRTTGCCNAPAIPQDVLDTYCSNSCISTTLTSVCDYRTPDMYASNPDVADLYLINEGRTRTGEYRIGSGTDSECIVKTDYVGWRPSGGMALDTSVNKTDDAGNSLMVEAYRHNMYCRVSCSENWQLSMQSFGNFTGKKAISAGSYFQITDDDLYVSGKRTCYTTFINYGSTEGSADDGGFTQDLNVQSNNLVDSYNHYSNLSHFYADLACENDKEYTTEGGHTVECAYSEIKVKASKFCYSSRPVLYCLTNSHVDGSGDGECLFEVPAKNEYYCDEGDSFSSNRWECDHIYNKHPATPSTCSKSLYYNYKNEPVCVNPEDEGEWLIAGKVCKDPTNYAKVKENTTDTTYYCYRKASWNPGTAAHCDDGDTTTTNGKCKHTYHAHAYWTCETSYYQDEDEYNAYYEGTSEYARPWTPAYALSEELGRYGLHNAEEIDIAKANVDALGVELVEEPANHSYFHMCRYRYDILVYNHCKEWAVCLNYYVSSSNALGGGINDGDKTPDGVPTGKGQYVNYRYVTNDGQNNSYPEAVGDLASYYSVRSLVSGGGTGLITGTVDNSKLDGYAYMNVNEARVDFAKDIGEDSSSIKPTRYVDNASGMFNKFRTTSDPSAYCSGGSWAIVPEEGISYASGGPVIIDKSEVAAGGSNVILTGLDGVEGCNPSTMPSCATKQESSGGFNSVYTFGNRMPTRFSNGNLIARDVQITYTEDGIGYLDFPHPTGGHSDYESGDNQMQSEENEAHNNPPAATPCGAAGNCDTERGKNVRSAFLNGMGIKGKLDGYAQSMVSANSNIVKFSRDMFDCQHFELYNATDGENNERTNNSQWVAKFMGHSRGFRKIVTSFDPEISYSYDEKEYMTILGSNNVMERFDELNDEIFGCYTIANRSGTRGCYNSSTNQKKDSTVKYYINSTGEVGEKSISLSRNYTENYYYNTNNSPWSNNSLAARSYGAEGFSANNIIKLTCPADEPNCNIGAQLSPSPDEGPTLPIDTYKRSILCTIGMIMDEPTTSTYSDGKTSETHLVYLNDKDYYWTAGECYAYQVQYLKANYVKASIENSSFFKNKGYWYVNTANDTKANGTSLRDALINSNNNIGSNYDPDDEEQLSRWSILGNYNVFPIKLTTPRDLYQYTYTFANIGSYGDGSLGRVMGRDQSLIALNSRTCFYEVFEELCLCCGNPIYAHVDSDLPYIFIGSSAIEYEMSNEDPVDMTSSTLAITTSNISLSDPTSDSNRELGDNWSDSSTFFFNGEMFTTAKGAELLDKIQVPGENIYSSEAEYRFTLNPEGLAKIREYNDSHIYGVTYEDLISIGRFAVNPYIEDTYLECFDISSSACHWNVDKTTDESYYPQNRIINFTHYGSNFLMNEIKRMRGVTFTGKYSDYTSVGMYESCYVTEGRAVSDLDSVASNCRWVDYVQYDDDIGRYFRLSYK